MDLAEAKLRARPVALAPIEQIRDVLRSRPGGDNIDTIVLACTHFPLLYDEFQQVFGPDVELIDGSQGIAQRIASLLDNHSFSSGTQNTFVVTGAADRVAGLESVLAQRGFDQIQAILPGDAL